MRAESISERDGKRSDGERARADRAGTRRHGLADRGVDPPDRLVVLRRSVLPSETESLARYLIGALLVRDVEGERCAGRIVETEAYVPGDPSSHAFTGRSARNASMFAGRGHAYVYFTYGMHYCLNVTSERRGVGAAVLVRALEPLAGLEDMRRRRGLAECSSDLLLARGPARLAQALAIDRRLDGIDLCRYGPLWLAAGSPGPPIGTSTRIGIKRAADRLLRFYERGNAFVSGPARLSP